MSSYTVWDTENDWYTIGCFQNNSIFSFTTDINNSLFFMLYVREILTRCIVQLAKNHCAQTAVPSLVPIGALGVN